MFVSQVKVGKVYAFIPEYDRHVRRYGNACVDLPPATPAVVVEKTKVSDGAVDSCGRPTGKNRTAIFCKRYKIHPTDPLALDLDVVEEHHPELVSVEEIPARDLVWGWEDEVNKIRSDAQTNMQMARFFDYLRGVSYRMLRHEIVRSKLEEFFQTRSEAALKIVYNSAHYGAKDSHFKQFLYDLLTGQYAVNATGANSYSSYSGGWSHDTPWLPVLVDAGYSLQVEYYFRGNGTNYSRQDSAGVEVQLSSSTYVRVLDAILDQFGHLEEYRKIRKVLEDYTYSADERARASSDREYFVKLARTFFVEEADDDYRLDIVEQAVNMWAQAVRSECGGNLPKFSRNKDWKGWAEGEQFKLRAYLPVATKESDEDS